MSDTEYITPVPLRDTVQKPLPSDGKAFCFTLHTTLPRLQEMIAVLFDGVELLELPPIGDYNIDLLSALATYDECEDDMPIVGEIRMFLLEFPPQGWLAMDKFYPVADYPDLANVLPSSMMVNGQIRLDESRGVIFAGAVTNPDDLFFAPTLGGRDYQEFNRSTQTSDTELRVFGVNFFIYAGK